MPSKAIATARHKAGLCITCGLEPPDGYFKRTCQGCRDKAKLRTTKRRKVAKKSGTCEACMRRKRAPGKSRCLKCYKKYGTKNTAEVA
jgi:hypothetical protein